MKLMKFSFNEGQRNSFMEILKTTPQRAMSTDELFIRVDMQKKFLVAKDELFLENEEHKIALRAVDEFPYQVATQEICDIITAVRDAKTPPADKSAG